MNLFQATEIEIYERQRHADLLTAFESARPRSRITRREHLAVRAHVGLLAVNLPARLRFARAACRTLQNSFALEEDDLWFPSVPMVFVTVTDISCNFALVDLSVVMADVRRKLGRALRGLSFLGVIEPALYLSLAPGVRFAGRQCISWHLHALVWGDTISDMKALLARVEQGGRYRALASGFRGVHIANLKPKRFPELLRYTFGSPSQVYKIVKRERPIVLASGEERWFSQYANQLSRPAQRLQYYRHLREHDLEALLVGGGEGRDLVACIKDRLGR